MTLQELWDRYLLARTIYWREAVIGMEDGAVADLEETLLKVKREIEKLLDEEAAGLARITDWNRERMQSLEAFCDEALAGAKEAAARTILDASGATASASLQNYYSILSLDGLIASVGEVALTAAQIRAWFQTTPLGGHSLTEWVERAFSKGVKASLLMALRESGLQGMGTAAQVKKLLHTALDEGFLLTRREATTLARTYTQTANVEAQMAVYKANEDIIRGYEWLATLDNRVCPRCAALDGRFYKKDEKIPPRPLHPRCRCLLLPKVSADGLPVAGEGLERVARPWVIREPGNIDAGGKRKILYGGQTTEKFSGWWKTLPEKEQVNVVGPKRYELLKAGKISFEELVDKGTGRLRTLEELGLSSNGSSSNISNMLRNKLQREADNVKVALSEPATKKELSLWISSVIDKIAAGNYHTNGERHIVGAFDDDVLSFFERENINLSTSALSIEDKDFAHALRDVKPKKLPVNVWNDLPEILKSASSIFWNFHENALVYAINKDEVLGKIIVQLNVEKTIRTRTANGKTRERKIFNNVRTGAKIKDLREFSNSGWYKKVR